MKKTSILYTAALAGLMSVSLSSCDKYLDEEPDNRTTIDTADKVSSLLTSAYPQSGSYIMMNEAMSDNCDNMGSSYNNYSSRYLDEFFAWKTVTEEGNDGPESLWIDYYRAIAAANEALKAIDELGTGTTLLKECRGEALLCRAYCHFVLVNQFCKSYNPATAATDLGVTYMTKPETTVKPEYSRGTVKEVYEQIDKDLQEGLGLIGDSHLEVAKYHFNTQAAYAFATRFYLYYQQYEKAVEYANKCLGSNAGSMLRDWDAMESWGVTNDLSPRTIAYIDATANCNLLITSAISGASLFNSNYAYFTKYTHDRYLSRTECAMATNLWGIYYAALRCEPMVFQASGMDRTIIAKSHFAFWEVDAVAKTGYYMTVSVPLKADGVLLDRAEAYIMLKQYDKACTDMTTWMQNFTTTTLTLNTDTIDKFYKGMDYYTWQKPTLKKHFNPTFTYDGEGTLQESMLQCVINFKRIEDVHEGTRWWDINRYGMVIYRRVMNADGYPESVSDSLTVNDPRRAIQLPTSVVEAGLTPNPRSSTEPSASMRVERTVLKAE